MMRRVLPALQKLASLPVLVCVAPLPFFYALFLFYSAYQKLDLLEAKVATLQRKSTLIQGHKEKESAFLAQIEQADNFYIDKNLESFDLLAPEIKTLRASEENESAKQRLRFLEEKNRLLFVEQQIRRTDNFQELEEKLQEPVEVNEVDLRKLLTLIEGVPIPPHTAPEHRPQMIIKNFELTKKAIAPQENVFVLDLQLIKRESLKK